MTNPKKAKYFCENCGSEVASNARFCPKCGKFFSSVRCPKCGCTGDVKKFKNGCPQCGYAMPLGGLNGNTEGTPQVAKHLSKKSKRMISTAFSAYNGATKQENVQVNEDAPAWLFIVCVVVLLGIISFIVLRMHS